jgi:beta-phosphoglucomutase-like phosphatase (HAD superfamily)
MIKAALFDMDSVLIDSEQVYKGIDKQMYKALVIDMHIEKIHESMGMAVVEWWRKVLDDYGINEDPEKLAKLKENVNSIF